MYCVVTSVLSDSSWSMDFIPPGFSVDGILQAGILDWVAIYFSSGSSQPRNQPVSLPSTALPGVFFTASTTWEPLHFLNNPNYVVLYDYFSEFLGSSCLYFFNIFTSIFMKLVYDFLFVTFQSCWESHGQRSLLGHSPWHRNESDMTKWLTLHYYY